MTVGDKQYNEADMLRMQREAEARVQEMQARARRTVEDANQNGYPMGGFGSRNRNWSNNSSTYRQRNARRGNQQSRGQNGQGSQRQTQSQESPAKPQPGESRREEEGVPVEPVAERKKEGTILGDIMAALGLDEDYLLIIGLILILINQRADTTLILALAYLLI